MDRYIEFNAVKFIKESRSWESEKKRLEAKPGCHKKVIVF